MAAGLTAATAVTLLLRTSTWRKVAKVEENVEKNDVTVITLDTFTVSGNTDDKVFTVNSIALKLMLIYSILYG